MASSRAITFSSNSNSARSQSSCVAGSSNVKRANSNKNVPLTMSSSRCLNYPFVNTSSNTSSNFKRVPSPPKRKSSRNNRTLKLYSSTTCTIDSQQQHRAAASKIRLLKENLNLTLEKQRREKGRCIYEDSLRFRPSTPKKPVIRVPSSPPIKRETKIRRLKKEQEESCKRLSRSQAELTRRQRETVTKFLPSGTVVKTSRVPASNQSLKVTVAISPRGRELLKKSSEKNSSESSKKDSTQKDSAGKLKKEGMKLTTEALNQHQENARTSSFFQNLFLRDVASTENSDSSFVLERAKVIQESGTKLENYQSEPSLKYLGKYLSHKRPVSNSRFKSWERESFSSRSSSPFAPRSKFDSLPEESYGSLSSLIQESRAKERSLSEPPHKHQQQQESTQHLRRSPSLSPVRSSKRKKNYHEKCTTEILEENSLRRCAEYESDISLTRSTNSLIGFPVNREKYQQYIQKKLHSKRKSKRYQELLDFYSSLEKMASLEKTASASDLKPRTRNEDVIDYDRWKSLRSKERAEQELKFIYKKLRTSEKEHDFLFRTKDVKRFKWQGDPSLRCKEKSVENICGHFQKLEKQQSELEAQKQREIASKKDTYKPLWRGNSVASVAGMIRRRAEENAEFDKGSIRASLQKSLGGSNKFWSSLSLDQVNALKNQLNDIFGSDSQMKTRNPPTLKVEEVSDYEVIVPRVCSDQLDEGKGLHVRCHSMILSELTPDKNEILRRSDSIGAPMSEVEKKRLSLCLGQEMMERINQKVIKPRETLGAMAAALATKTEHTGIDQVDSATESSEASIRTVVDKPAPMPCKLAPSQSFADFKELFGETASARPPSPAIFAGRAEPDVAIAFGSPCRPASSATTSSLASSRISSPDPDRYWRSYLKLVRNGQVRRLRAKFESLEDLSDHRGHGSEPKRFRSDPELARNILGKPDVAWLRRRYENPNPNRGRRRYRTSPIPRVPWKLDDLKMPHINVISKMAELKSDYQSPRSTRTTEETRELEAKRPVNRMREIFEKSLATSEPSILGEMFTSDPNVHELRDITPYLTGNWVAHMFPSRYHNCLRSLSSPPDLSRDARSITPPSRFRKLTTRSSSCSPVRPRTPVSILKQQQQQKDFFANQEFDPSKHQPSFRYQPSPPPPPSLNDDEDDEVDCCATRPTAVKFEGSDC